MIRAFKVQNIVTMQNQLLGLGKEVSLTAGGTVKPANIAEMAGKAVEAFQTDPNS